jgi:hypothetical protein
MQRAYKWVRMLFCACLLAVLLVAIESMAAPKLTGRATASSSQDTYRAEFAVHGDLNTRWIEPLPPKSQAILGGRGLRGSYCRGVCASGTASACTEHATRSIHLRLGPPAGRLRRASAPAISHSEGTPQWRGHHEYRRRFSLCCVTCHFGVRGKEIA